MRYEYEDTSLRRQLKTWARQAARMAIAAACTIMVLQATNAAAMTADDCEKLSDDALLLAVDQGLCTLDVLPSAGPPPQVADNGTTGEHDGGNSGGGSGGGGDSGGDDGDGGDDGGDNGGDDGGDNGGDDGDSGGDDGGSGGDDGHGHDHGHGHGHGGHGHGHGGQGHGGCGD